VASGHAVIEELAESRKNVRKRGCARDLRLVYSVHPDVDRVEPRFRIYKRGPLLVQFAISICSDSDLADGGHVLVRGFDVHRRKRVRIGETHDLAVRPLGPERDDGAELCAAHALSLLGE
jgi:hypothetical protein